MIELKKTDKKFPDVGEWTYWTNAYGKKSTVVRCGCCNKIETIDDHTISPDGTVSPSVVCAYAEEGCPWHVYLRLLGF